jgi:hypothetical protein
MRQNVEIGMEEAAADGSWRVYIGQRAGSANRPVQKLRDKTKGYSVT